jgi:hypothetical protein
MKFYKLSDGSTGRPIATYLKPQPSIGGLLLLPDPPNDYSEWDGSEWVLDDVGYKKQTWKQLFQLLKDNLFEIIVNKRDGGQPEFDFNDVTIKAKNFKDNLAGLTTKEDIDAAYDSAMTWMGLE